MHEAAITDILDPISAEVIDSCLGPTASTQNAGPEYWNIWIPSTSQHCPRAGNLAALGY